MKMTFKNAEIVEMSRQLRESFNENQNFPAKVIFYIQKNQNILNKLSEEIENVRLSILRQYGDLNEDKTYYILREDFKDEATKKIIDLGEIEQTISLNIISLKDLDNISLTYKQMEAIMFMIEEDI